MSHVNFVKKIVVISSWLIAIKANAVFALELFTAVAKFVNLGKIFVSVNDS